MIRPVLSLCLIATGLLLCSCIVQGELRVRNRSTTDIDVSFDYDNEVILPNEDLSRFYNSDTTVHVEYDGLYVFKGYSDVYVELGSREVINIVSDGGAIQVVNNSPHTIDHVYLATQSATSWGSDDLIGNIPPGGSAIWTSNPGIWDIKIVNNLDQSFYSYNHDVDMDTTETYLFEEGKNTSDQKAGSGIEPTGARTEQKDQRIKK